MSNFKFRQIEESNIQVIDGDRGVNYPSKSELLPKGYCVFLNTGNVTKTGFDFAKVEFITQKKDNLLRKGKTSENDIILTTRGTVGNVAIVDKDLEHKCIRINSGMVIIRTDSSEFIPYYLYLFFRSDLFKKQCLTKGSGSAQPQLPISALKYVSIPYWPIPVQNNIVGILSVLDAKIELNNRINTELEAMAKTLYDYWFVQFDFPDANDKPYKTSGGKMVYNPTLKREIPEGWKVNTLADWIACDKTGDWGKESKEGNYTLQVDCIRGADINGLNGNGKIATPNRFILSKNKTKLLSPFDLVIEISGGSPVQSTGRIAYLTQETFERFNHPLICSNFCKAISLFDNQYFYNFVYQWKAIYDNGILFGWEGKTSGIKNLLFDSFVTKHYVCLPPEELARNFYKFVEPLQKKKEKLLNENSELVSLRDWLLPMLMNGQVAVR